MGFFADEVASGDRRRALLALRDYLVAALEGDPEPDSALVLRLHRVLDDLDSCPASQTHETPEGVVTLDSIRNRRTATGESATDDSARTDLGTKNAARRQGGRKPRR